MKGEHIKGMLLALAGYAVFAIGDGIAKYYGQIYSPASVLFWAHISALPVLILWTASSRGGVTRLWHAQKFVHHISRGLCASLQFITFFYAIAHIPLATAFSIIFCTPVFTAILAGPVLGQWPDRFNWFAIMSGLLGVIIIVRPGLVEFNTGLAAALLSSILGAVVVLITRIIGGTSTHIFAFYPMAATVLVLGVALSITDSMTVPREPDHVMMLMLLGLTSIFGFLLVSRAFIIAPVADAGSMQYSQIIWGSLIGWLIFGEMPDILTYLGCAIVIVSGLLLIRRKRKIIWQPV